MKCIRCQVDNTLRDYQRYSGRCRNCRHLFVFEPTRLGSIKITDQLFKRAIAEVSANNSLYFTSKQLYYSLERRLGNWHYRLRAKIPCISQAQFETWLDQWQRINGIPDRLLMALDAAQIPSPQVSNHPINADVSDYSFDRAIVCDTATIARLLIKNNFHFENNCAVLSLDGYPHQIFETTMQMLRRNSDLKVYALHDCTLQGVGLAPLLRTDPRWFQSSSATIIDVGLLPRQKVHHTRGFPIHQKSNLRGETLPLNVRSTLSEEEIQWLEAGNYVELEVFSPRNLIQILQQGIARTRTPKNLETGSGIPAIDSTGDNLYAIESFG